MVYIPQSVVAAITEDQQATQPIQQHSPAQPMHARTHSLAPATHACTHSLTHAYTRTQTRTALHRTAPHCTAPHRTALHCTALHCTALLACAQTCMRASTHTHEKKQDSWAKQLLLGETDAQGNDSSDDDSVENITPTTDAIVIDRQHTLLQLLSHRNQQLREKEYRISRPLTTAQQAAIDTLRNNAGTTANLDIFELSKASLGQPIYHIGRARIFFNISEHADGERRGPVSIWRQPKDASHRDLSDATLRCRSSPLPFAVSHAPKSCSK